jgi:hypothetical protein
LKVFGPPDCCVAVYQTGDFNGWKGVFGVGEYNYEQFKRHGAWKDTSAFKVKRGGCEQLQQEPTRTFCFAKLFEHGMLDGHSTHYDEGDYNYDAM